jgi:hypothetical protein
VEEATLAAEAEFMARAETDAKADLKRSSSRRTSRFVDQLRLL